MPEGTRKGVEGIKCGEIDKHKKIWEDEEGPPTKKQKKMTAAQEGRVKSLAIAAEKRECEARGKLDNKEKKAEGNDIPLPEKRKLGCLKKNSSPSEWAQYAEPKELDEFFPWLNPKGVQELALKNSFIKRWSHIAPGSMRGC
ncbi:hypothetical protein F4604DRAFT_1929277 [Suillus subluteus]|nr:hypothetical protein F4604DRAFT_1929277 [Suillus subluteus]